jgi:hypothetical protein
MRRIFALILLAGFWTPAQSATGAQMPSGANAPVTGLRAMKEYRARPDPKSVPPMIRTMSQQGAFKDPDSAGVYVGFLAGVLATNPRGAKTLVAQLLPLPFEDQWLPIRAIAYSGLPQWRDLMRDLGRQLPDRKVMIEGYLAGKYPTLDQVRLEIARPTMMDKMKGVFKRETYLGGKKEKPRELTFESNPDLVDIYWGLYFATARDDHIEKIMTLLPWSQERDNLQKLSLGSMAKLTLALNASHDVDLLGQLKRLAPRQSKAVEPVAREVIEAAETSETGRIKKEALAAVEELRTKGPGSKREVAWWGKVGETAISLGCIGAAVTGQVEFGVPCVIGGALSSAAVRYFASP